MSSENGAELAKGKARLPNETTEVLRLNGTAFVYSEVTQNAWIGQEFQDMVNITGRIPEGGWMIWNLFREATCDDELTDAQADETGEPGDEDAEECESGSVLDDELVWTSPAVPLKDAVEPEDPGLLRMYSPRHAEAQAGRYYFVEVLYSPLQEAPVAVGEPRLENETVEVHEHVGAFSTYSQTQDFVRVGADFYDAVYIIENTPEATAELAGATVEWNVYRENLDSPRPEDDELVYHLGPSPVSLSAKTAAGELMVVSPKVHFVVPGRYYFVEELLTPQQTAATGDAVFRQSAREVSESIVVENTNDKYIRIGKRVTRSPNLALTGLSLGHLAGTAAMLAGIGAGTATAARAGRRRTQGSRKNRKGRHAL
jgi:hypothetical protein